MALEQAWVFGFYVWPAYRHWLTKNIMVTGCTFIVLRLLNALILDIDQWGVGPEPDLIASVWTLATIHLQDFRDMEGDRKTHAVTMPLVLSPEGRTKLRHATACVLITGNCLSMLWIWMRAQCASAFVTGLFFNISSCICAFYTVMSASRYQDRVMYRWWVVAGFCMINHVYNLYLLR
jgi:4-hydroxybenzoate polyprenyltransferase